MKKTRTYVKLIDVSHEEWMPIMAEFLYKYCTTMSYNKDTYWCIASKEEKDFLFSVQQRFSDQGKTILIN